MCTNKLGIKQTKINQKGDIKEEQLKAAESKAQFISAYQLIKVLLVAYV
jgi:hypothetical protein